VCKVRQFACLLITDPPFDGAWNMAIDEGLLEAAAKDHLCALRFYGWADPTLSLGYFQRYQDRYDHKPSLACPLVRRASGGGAILHHRELTYSIALASSHPLARRSELLYRAVHESLVVALLQLGVSTSLYAAQPSSIPPRTADERFLCFERRVDGDVILDGHKIAGSAQRRRHAAVLQHGSILLERSYFAPSLPGIAELAGRVLTFEELRDVWSPQLAQRLGANLQNGYPPPMAAEYASEIAESRYVSDAWNLRR
jgi:lipoyl(octanoyl) transferase